MHEGDLGGGGGFEASKLYCPVYSILIFTVSMERHPHRPEAALKGKATLLKDLFYGKV